MPVYQVPAPNRMGRQALVDVGVVGGIEQFDPGGADEYLIDVDMTASPYNCDPTGVANCSSALSQAIADHAGQGANLNFPDGDYYFAGTIVVQHGSWHVRIKGSAKGAPNDPSLPRTSGVRFIVNGGGGKFMDWGTGSDLIGTEQTVTGTKTFGTTALTVSSSSGYTAGDLIRVIADNEEDDARMEAGADFQWSQGGARFLRKFCCKVVSVSSGTINIFPGLPWDTTHQVTKVFNSAPVATWKLRHFGIQSVAIMPKPGTYMSFCINMQYCDECYIDDCYLRCGSGGTTSEIKFIDSFRTHIRGCDIDNSNIYSDGKIQGLSSSNALIEDCVSLGISPAWYNSGNTCNIVFFGDDFQGTGEPSAYFAHEPYPTQTWVEYCILRSFSFDHYHGNSGRNNILSSWITCADEDFSPTPRYGCVSNRFTRGNVMANCVIGVEGIVSYHRADGYPNIGNLDSIGTSKISDGDFPDDWKLEGTLTNRIDDNTCVVTMDSSIGQLRVNMAIQTNGPNFWADDYSAFLFGKMNVIAVSGLDVTFQKTENSGGTIPAEGTHMKIWTGTFGFQERELDCANTDLNPRDHNFLAQADDSGSIENPVDGGTTFVSEVYPGGAPVYWGDRPWPPFGADIPLTSLADVERIPAGLRRITGSGPTPPSVMDEIFTLPQTANSANVIELWKIDDAEVAFIHSGDYPAGDGYDVPSALTVQLPAGVFNKHGPFGELVYVFNQDLVPDLAAAIVARDAL